MHDESNGYPRSTPRYERGEVAFFRVDPLLAAISAGLRVLLTRREIRHLDGVTTFEFALTAFLSSDHARSLPETPSARAIRRAISAFLADFTAPELP